VAIQEVPDTEKIKHETNKIFLGFGASVIQRFYETWKIKPRFYFAGFLRFVCDMALLYLSELKLQFDLGVYDR
jgi:hypothetical protein